MTRPEFEEMAARFPYYNGRWGYMSKALAEASTLIEEHGLRTALELGAPVRPIIVGADVMDIGSSGAGSDDPHHGSTTRRRRRGRSVTRHTTCSSLSRSSST